MKAIKKLTNNSWEINTESNKFLQSYDVIVARVDSMGYLTLSSMWDFSNTTKKHLTHWLQEKWRSDATTANVRKAIANKEVQVYPESSLNIY